VIVPTAGLSLEFLPDLRTFGQDRLDIRSRITAPPKAAIGATSDVMAER